MKLQITLGAVILYLAFQIYLFLAAPGKIAPELQTGSAKANVLVTLPFAPERFHILVFQRYGRVSGTRDNSIELRGVTHDNLRAVARPYWVNKVEPLKGDGS